MWRCNIFFSSLFLFLFCLIHILFVRFLSAFQIDFNTHFRCRCARATEQFLFIQSLFMIDRKNLWSLKRRLVSSFFFSVEVELRLAWRLAVIIVSNRRIVFFDDDDDDDESSFLAMTRNRTNRTNEKHKEEMVKLFNYDRNSNWIWQTRQTKWPKR